MSELSQTTARGIVERLGAGQPKDPGPAAPLRALKAIRDHWREFGPSHGFDECVEQNTRHLDEWLYGPSSDAAPIPMREGPALDPRCAWPFPGRAADSEGGEPV